MYSQISLYTWAFWYVYMNNLMCERIAYAQIAHVTVQFSDLFNLINVCVALSQGRSYRRGQYCFGRTHNLSGDSGDGAGFAPSWAPDQGSAQHLLGA